MDYSWVSPTTVTLEIMQIYETGQLTSNESWVRTKIIKEIKITLKNK